jgi:hypothetical protein
VRRKLDVDLDDRSIVHEVGDGRHGLNGHRSRQLRNRRLGIVTRFRDDCCATITRQLQVAARRRCDATVKKGQRYAYSFARKRPRLRLFQDVLKQDRPDKSMPPVPTIAIECVIRAQPEQHFLRLEAIARSDAPAAGEYRFSVAKRSSSGSSSNAQTGTFVLKSGHEQVLTTILLDRSAIGNYHAELSLQSDRERFTCTSP